MNLWLLPHVLGWRHPSEHPAGEGRRSTRVNHLLEPGQHARSGPHPRIGEGRPVPHEVVALHPEHRRATPWLWRRFGAIT